jgi:succinate dehydrogenase / fumarate reductase, cytochrome b subunit
MPLKALFGSSIGKKLGMALTGIALYGFLIGHLAGNLLLFSGDGGAVFNQYSAFLTEHPLIIPTELVLLAIFIAHIAFAISVSRENKRARPIGYRRSRWVGNRTLASYTMLYSGLFILLFVVVHVKTFKYGDLGGGTLYQLVTQTFQQPLYVLGYIGAMLILGFHLWHAFQSACQTLGLSTSTKWRSLSGLLSIVLAGGFGSIPLIIFLF